MTSDNRMTWGLIIDVLGVLERHGYHQHDNQHTGQAIAVIGDLASVYEGTRDLFHSTYPGQAPPSPHAEPERRVPEAEQDAVILTGADVTTVVTTLDLAVGYKRDRAATCADCADQSCLTCQSRLHDAQAYDQMAAGLLQTAHAAWSVNATQPEPGSPGITPGQADPAADREAGQ